MYTYQLEVTVTQQRLLDPLILESTKKLSKHQLKQAVLEALNNGGDDPSIFDILDEETLSTLSVDKVKILCEGNDDGESKE